MQSALSLYRRRYISSFDGLRAVLVTGVLLQHLGFTWAFVALAAVSVLAALVYLGGVPETGERVRSSTGTLTRFRRRG